MRVWVKEYKDILKCESVANWLKENINVLKYISEEAVDPYDIIFFSKEDDCNKNLKTCAKLICYEECVASVLRACGNDLYANYDYHFLKNSMTIGKEKCSKNIIVGSSYGLFGVDADKLDATINCSLSSQDIFYSCRIIYDICLRNPAIKNVIFVCYYYILFSDLSLIEDAGEKIRLRDVYYPMFGDMHNSLFVEKAVWHYPDSLVFDMEKAMRVVERKYLKKAYFSKERRRGDYAFKNWGNSLCWQDLTENVRDLSGKKRADSHAKSIRYEKSYNENIEYLKELSSFCLENGITLTFMIAPASKYYRKYEKSEFKDKFYEALQMLPGTVHVIDLHDSEMFQLEDFNDMDHLGDAGAEKMTQVLKEYLEK